MFLFFMVITSIGAVISYLRGPEDRIIKQEERVDTIEIQVAK